MSRSRLISIIKVVVFLAALLPLTWLVWKTLRNDLGANPVEFISTQPAIGRSFFCFRHWR